MRSRTSPVLRLLAAGAVLVGSAVLWARGSQAAHPAGTTVAKKAPAQLMGAAAYVYGTNRNLAQVMNATGVRWFTMAFILSGGGCKPAWDGRSDLGGTVANLIHQAQGAGGDVVASFGGWSGNKLGPNCPNPGELAGAYQKVIDTFHLKGVDLD